MTENTTENNWKNPAYAIIAQLTETHSGLVEFWNKYKFDFTEDYQLDKNKIFDEFVNLDSNVGLEITGYINSCSQIEKNIDTFIKTFGRPKKYFLRQNKYHAFIPEIILLNRYLNIISFATVLEIGFSYYLKFNLNSVENSAQSDSRRNTISALLKGFEIAISDTQNLTQDSYQLSNDQISHHAFMAQGLEKELRKMENKLFIPASLLFSWLKNQNPKPDIYAIWSKNAIQI